MSTSPQQTNEAVTTTEAFVLAFARRDWVALRQLIADDCEIEDHRPGVAGYGVSIPPDSHVDAYKQFADLGFDRIELGEPVGLRGSRIAAIPGVVAGRHGFEICAIQLGVTNADGRYAFIEYFDCENVEAALAELDNQERLRGNAQ